MLQLETVSVVTCCELEVKAAGTDAAVDEDDDCWSTSIWFSSTSNTFKQKILGFPNEEIDPLVYILNCLELDFKIYNYDYLLLH